MARGSTQAQSGSSEALSDAGTLAGEGQGLYSTLAPQLSNEATNPQGFAPADLAAMNTAGQQSAGGSEAAAVGAGGLAASRTKNAGAAGSGIAAGVRAAGENLEKGALGTQIKNANVKQQQQQSALKGEEGLYGTDIAGANAALGETAANVNANTNAEGASYDWAKYLLDPAMQAAGSAHY
jgi:hypothetical protein